MKDLKHKLKKYTSINLYCAPLTIQQRQQQDLHPLIREGVYTKKKKEGSLIAAPKPKGPTSLTS
jgi:hypothetical protein